MNMPENHSDVNPYAEAVKVARKAREASHILRTVPSVMKNRTLHILSELLQKHINTTFFPKHQEDDITNDIHSTNFIMLAVGTGFARY